MTTVTISEQVVNVTTTETGATVTVAPVSVGVSVAPGSTSFLGLSDTPDAYTSQGGKAVAVKSDASGLEFVAFSGGVTDHGALTGLGDDDHPQYHTDARGDLRYWPLSTDMATQAELDAEASARVSGDSTNAAAISSEASTRASADTTLQSNITSEAAARAAADSAHAALTTTAHGGIVASSDSRLSDARTPTAHASSHASAGTDPLTLAQSQITGLVAALAGKEPSLGNPASDGYVLSSTALGVRSWIPMSGGGGGSPFVAANDAAVPLISRGFSPTQSGNLEEWQASDLSVLAFMSHDALLAIGSLANPYDEVGASAYNLFTAGESFTSMPQQNYAGMFAVMESDLASDSGAILFALNFSASTKSGSAGVPGSGIRGVQGEVDHNGDGALGSATAFKAFVFNFGTGTLGTAIGLDVNAIDDYSGNHADTIIGVNIGGDGFGLVNNRYGIKIDDQTGDATGTRFSIWTGGGLHSFGDDLEWRDTAKGPILIDRGDATRRRIICTAGVLSTEAA